VRCPSCGEDNPQRAKFCLACATPLTEAEPSRREERKIVSVLFCDLVNFTAASELADPEDVRARLVPYHAMLRERIENFGGTVEKFVGDAVMAVFGAPVAHEDDAERAVRAGLAILSAIDDLNAAAAMDLSVRVGVNTGEVVVALGARPELGEGFVTGDVVNTAARIQSAAPVGAVAVGESTYAATSRVFAYEPLEPATVKGKANPLTLWRAGPPRARLGADVVRSTDSPLVGRELELLQLRAAFDRVARDSAVHLVTITGEPGVGKSRLVAELFSYVDDLPELVTWRTGRCLPYGDGVTFWALGEIVKSHAGILDTDDAAAARAKLTAVLPDQEDTSWLRARLLPLIGVTADSAGSTASQEESFTAWRRFLELFASTGPAVMVVEDIHWADPALLQFLEHMTGWAHGVPLLIICTARPELFDSHPTWAAGLRNTITLNVTPLTEQETATVVSYLLGLRLLPAATQQLILERAEGNPLWAEECVRVLRDRSLIDAQGRLRSDEVPLPHGVQALIAARLDTLPDDSKALLADAAVVGRVFWADALVALGRRDADHVVTALRELTAKEFVRPHRETTLAGQAEYGFWHGLVRDVAYQTLPRSARAAKHLAASQWLEQLAGDRVADVAEILAEHTSQALDLAQAAGNSAVVDQVTPAARRYAVLAAQRVLQLDSSRAIALLDRVLTLTEPEDSDYPDVLLMWGQAASQVGRLREAVVVFQQAANHYLQREAVVPAGAALGRAASALHNLGDPSSRDVIEESLRLLESQEPSAELGMSLLFLALAKAESGAPEAALSTLQRVEPLITGDDLELLGRFHGVRGIARSYLGDPDGPDEIEQCIGLFIEADSAQGAAIGFYNLAEQSQDFDGPQVTLSRLDSGEEFCRARGLAGAAAWMRSNRVGCLAQVGQLREALALADALLPGLQEARDDMSFTEVASSKALVLAELDRCEQAEEVAREALRAASRTDGLAKSAAHHAAAITSWLAGHSAEAAVLLRELRDNPDPGTPPGYAAHVHQLVRCALAVGDTELARQFVALADAPSNPKPALQHALLTARAVLADAAGDYGTAVDLFTEAARRWDSFGSRLEHAHTLLSLAESRIAGGQGAAESLRQALELFTSMGAERGSRRCQELLRTGRRVEAEPQAG
jgi:class 3 adenylate cyclase/tetratricopeptide (TPR) repeat protein